MSSFWEEIKRRNVVRVTVAYSVVAWLLAQVAEFAVETFGAPVWVLRIFVVFLLLGLPLAVLLAWAFELTPGGIRKTPGEEGNVERPRRQTRAVFVVFILIAASFAAWLQFYGPDSSWLEPDVAARARPAAIAEGNSQHFDLAFPEDAPLALIGAAELGNGKQAFAISPNGKYLVSANALEGPYGLSLSRKSLESWVVDNVGERGLYDWAPAAVKLPSITKTGIKRIAYSRASDRVATFDENSIVEVFQVRSTSPPIPTRIRSRSTSLLRVIPSGNSRSSTSG